MKCICIAVIYISTLVKEQFSNSLRGHDEHELYTPAEIET